MCINWVWNIHSMMLRDVRMLLFTANCTPVTDFDDCWGNVTDLCPDNIVCACKDGEPFTGMCL